MPFERAGKLGGKQRTGQRVVAASRTNLDLYRTIAEQMGVNATDFGPPAFTSGALGEILV
jgi:hypothetical protein